ncbi:unnamed protein product, partial [Phaeothamnion confervicola]
MGETVYGGSPSDEAGDACANLTSYDQGVEKANEGYLLMSLISTVWGLTLPWQCRRFGVRGVWAAHLLVMAAVLTATPLVKEGQHGFAEALLACLGFPLAATMQ